MSRLRLMILPLLLGAVLNACSGASSGVPPSQPNDPNQLSISNSPQRVATAQSATTSTSAVPLHMPTWAFDEYWSEGENATAATVQKYLNYAQGGLGNDKALEDCTGSSCKSVFYTDPNFIYASTICPTAQEAAIESGAAESWYVHEAGYSDKAHRTYGTYAQTCNGKTQTEDVYALNSLSTAYQSYYKTFLQTNANAWDVYFMDDTSGEVLSQLYGPGGGFCHNSLPNHWCETSEEYPTDATVAQAHGSFVIPTTCSDSLRMGPVPVPAAAPISSLLPTRRCRSWAAIWSIITSPG